MARMLNRLPYCIHAKCRVSPCIMYDLEDIIVGNKSLPPPPSQCTKKSRLGWPDGKGWINNLLESFWTVKAFDLLEGSNGHGLRRDVFISSYWILKD